MTKLSVIINTLNEEKNLPHALASVKNIADEIVVVDMQSSDETQKIAKKAGAKIYEHARVGYVEPARNYAISKASGEWILVLDADEVISPSLGKKIKDVIKSTGVNYYRLPRKNIIFGKWIKHSRWWPDYNLRLFQKGFVEWSEIIHSVPTTQGAGLDFPAEEAMAIVHNHYESIEQYIERLNRYTTLHAKILVKEGYEFMWQDLVRKPVNEFLSRYFVGEAYKDGIHGLALAMLQAFSELTLYLKVWQAGKFEEKPLELSEVDSELKNAEADINYWRADSLIRGGRGGILARIKRKARFLSI